MKTKKRIRFVMTGDVKHYFDVPDNFIVIVARDIKDKEVDVLEFATCHGETVQIVKRNILLVEYLEVPCEENVENKNVDNLQSKI